MLFRSRGIATVLAAEGAQTVVVARRGNLLKQLQDELEQKKAYYNYALGTFPAEEAPGVSVFARNDKGEVFHTYSSYGRGLDILVGTYNLLDLVPKGRDERNVEYKMEWVRHHDRYETAKTQASGTVRELQSSLKSHSCCD